MPQTMSHSPRASTQGIAAGDFPASSELRTLAAGALVFLLLVAARWEIVDSPPYFDFAIGIWPEAEFLAESGFDYHRLRYEESHSLDRHGGRRSYMTSLVPTLLAVVLRATGSAYAARVLYHLFTFACASAAIVLFYRLLVARVGKTGSILAAAAVLTTPVFATQVDMTGLEMPLVAFCLATLTWLRGESYVRAALGSLGAFLVKPTGLLATVSLLAYLLVGWVLGRRNERARARRFLPGLGVSVAVLGIELLLLRWGGSIGAQVAEGPPFWMLAVWSPDLLLLAMLALVWTGALLARWTKQKMRDEDPESALDHWTSQAVTVYSVIFVLCVLGALNGVRFVPRYVAVIVPFVYLILAPLLLERARLRVTGRGLLAALVALNLVNWNGILYPEPSSALAAALGPPGTRFRHEGSFLERSHEYLADHRANQAVLATLAREAGGDPIVAGIPFTHFLAYPVLGYVDKPLAGYCINGFLDGVPVPGPAPTFEDVARLVVELPGHPIFLKTDNGFYHETARLLIPDPSGEDEVLAQPSGTATVAYRKSWRGSNPRAQSDWYLERLWPEDSVDAGAILRARSSRRQWERMRETDIDPRAAAGLLVLAWGEWAADQGWLESAARALLLANRFEPGRSAREDKTEAMGPGARVEKAGLVSLAGLAETEQGLSAREAAWVCLRWGWVARAREFLSEDLSRRVASLHLLQINEASVEEWLAVGRDREALVSARELASSWPDRPQVHQLLGMALLRQGKWEEASMAFGHAIRLAPTYAEAYNGLGLARARLGATEAAGAAFREATRWDPFHPDAINNWRGMSRRLRETGPDGVSADRRNWR